MNELGLIDAVRALWGIANDGDMPDNARVVLAAMLLVALDRPASRELCREFIAETCDLFGGMSLELVREEYERVKDRHDA